MLLHVDFVCCFPTVSIESPEENFSEVKATGMDHLLNSIASTGEGLNKKDFAEAIVSAGVHLSPSQVDALFELLDTDESGTIERSELSAFRARFRQLSP